MDSENQKGSTCSMLTTDAEGHSNLCCCYMIDEKGALDDPCYHPVGECCLDENAF